MLYFLGIFGKKKKAKDKPEPKEFIPQNPNNANIQHLKKWTNHAKQSKKTSKRL